MRRRRSIRQGRSSRDTGFVSKQVLFAGWGLFQRVGDLDGFDAGGLRTFVTVVFLDGGGLNNIRVMNKHFRESVRRCGEWGTAQQSRLIRGASRSG
jgi:hypothetical protein